MKSNVTISRQSFSNKFDGVLMNNATIHTILSKETNLGFTTKLVTDQLKSELVEALFEDEEEVTDNNTSEAEGTVKEETPNESSDESEEETPAETPGDDLDELDELED